MSLLRSSLFLSVLVMAPGASLVLAQPESPSTREESSADGESNQSKETSRAESETSGRLHDLVPEVVIIDSPLGEHSSTLGTPLASVGNEELNIQAVGSLGDALATKPGVATTSFGPGASRPIIRGLGGDRVRILENGVSLGDVSQTSDDHAIGFSPLNTELVQILTGPAALAFSSSAMGGAVNILDDSIPESPIGSPATGVIDLRGGNSADDERAGSARLEGQAGSFNWFVSGFSRDTDDIAIPGFAESERLREAEAAEEDGEEDAGGEEETHIKDRLLNSATWSTGVKVGGSYVTPDGFLGLSLRNFSTRYGVPGHSHAHGEEGHDDEHHADESHEDSHDEEDHLIHERRGFSSTRALSSWRGLVAASPDVKIDLEQNRIEARGGVRIDEGVIERVRVSTAFSNYNHRELEGENVGTRFDNDSFSTRLDLTQRAMGDNSSWRGNSGLQVNYEDLSASGAEAFIPPSRTWIPAIFSLQQFSISDSWTLRGGGRLELVDVELATQSSRYSSSGENFVPASISSSLEWSPSSGEAVTLSTLYSERAPTVTELFAFGPHAATRTFEIGNPGIGKERGFASELSYRRSREQFSWNANLYWRHFFDYIAQNPQGEEMDGLPVFIYENTRANFTGFDGGMTASVLDVAGHRLVLGLGGDYVYAQDLEQDSSLPRIPPFRATSSLTYLYDIYSLSVEGLFAAKQNRLAENELATDGYASLNLRGSIALQQSDSTKTEVYAIGTNLTNEEIRYHTSFLKDLAPARGRAALVGVRFLF